MGGWDKTPKGELYKNKPDNFGYACPNCGQIYNTNPEDPPPPHTKPNLIEFCVTPEQWHEWLDEIHN